MEQRKVRFLRENCSVSVKPGTTVLEAQRLAGLMPDAPCGGKGTCGKCRVTLVGEDGSKEVLACQTPVETDLLVDTGREEKTHVILSQGMERKIPLDPVLRQGKLTFPKMKIGDPDSQWQRILSALRKTFGEDLPLQPDLSLSGELYAMLRKTDTWYAVLGQKGILRMTEKEIPAYAAAVDIGTTSVVGYLLEPATGKTLASASRINPQAQYGADVILRADYASQNGTEALSSCIRSCLNEIFGELSEKAEINQRDICTVCCVGNTCMHHLLLGLSPDSLSHAPYNPVVRTGLVLKAGDYGLDIAPRGELILLPNIAGFVGADTMGCLLCTRPDQSEEISLMIDIGTNGEMVLGNRRGLVTCSTAAGPAFEGAKIECGMRGASGAVDHVRYENGSFSYTTVGGTPALGICGSGLIDLVACMRKAGLIDESGYLQAEDGSSRFILVPPEKSGNGKPVYLSQKDIREVQLAKAAIAAGITLMRKQLDLPEEKIDRVYIAGAFGNYMDAASACAIGMIPPSLEEKIIPIGNAAGEGAKIALLSRRELEAGEAFSRKIQFLELASSPEFQDCFVDELEFS